MNNELSFKLILRLGSVLLALTALLIPPAAAFDSMTMAAPALFAVTPKLIISEFRLRGPNGANDEFVEIYNNSDTDHTVDTADNSAGYALVASDGGVRFFIPNGTLIPARAHFLGVNSIGYSLDAYPAGSGTTATGDVLYNTNIEDNAGIALFKTSNPANFNLANRLDAVGSTFEANTLFKEGAGYPQLTPFSINYSFTRTLCPRASSSSNPVCASCEAGFPIDTDTNAFDFIFVDPNGSTAGAGQRLGAPGPENSTSPGHVVPGPRVSFSLLDSLVPSSSSPNLALSTVSDPANNSIFGTITIRRKFTNLTFTDITRLRYRIVELTTFPAPNGRADLRPRTAPNTIVQLSSGSFVAVAGSTLESPPSQLNGGGFNTTFSANSVTLAQPLSHGESINLQFLFGVQQKGFFRIGIVIETQPFSNSPLLVVEGVF